MLESHCFFFYQPFWGGGTDVALFCMGVSCQATKPLDVSYSLVYICSVPSPHLGKRYVALGLMSLWMPIICGFTGLPLEEGFKCLTPWISFRCFSDSESNQQTVCMSYQRLCHTACQQKETGRWKPTRQCNSLLSFMRKHKNNLLVPYGSDQQVLFISRWSPFSEIRLCSMWLFTDASKSEYRNRNLPSRGLE